MGERRRQTATKRSSGARAGHLTPPPPPRPSALVVTARIGVSPLKRGSRLLLLECFPSADVRVQSTPSRLRMNVHSFSSIHTQLCTHTPSLSTVLSQTAALLSSLDSGRSPRPPPPRLFLLLFFFFYPQPLGHSFNYSRTFSSSHTQMSALLPQLLPSADFEDKRERVRVSLERSLMKQLPEMIPKGSTLRVFGSSINGFGNDGADLDM